MNNKEKDNDFFCTQNKIKYRQEETYYCKEIFHQYIAKNNNTNLIRRMF